MLTNKLGLFQMQLGACGQLNPTKIFNFYLHFYWHKFVIWIWAFIFHENWQFNDKLGHSFSPTSKLCLKDYPQNLGKIWNQGDFKKPYFFTLVNWGKLGSTTWAYIHKTQVSIFFMNWEKLSGSARATLKLWKSTLQ